MGVAGWRGGTTDLYPRWQNPRAAIGNKNLTSSVTIIYVNKIEILPVCHCVQICIMTSLQLRQIFVKCTIFSSFTSNQSYLCNADGGWSPASTVTDHHPLDSFLMCMLIE